MPVEAWLGKHQPPLHPTVVKLCKIKFTILTTVKCIVQQYIRFVVKQISGTFSTCKSTTILITQQLPFPLSPWHLQTTILLSGSLGLTILIPHIIVVRQYLSFTDWLISPGIISLQASFML